MYAVFQSGGKQHRVSEGQVVRLEKLELATGATVEFDSVLMVVNGEDVKIGAPVVAGAKVVAEVVAQVVAIKLKSLSSVVVNTAVNNKVIVSGSQK